MYDPTGKSSLLSAGIALEFGASAGGHYSREYNQCQAGECYRDGWFHCCSWQAQ